MTIDRDNDDERRTRVARMIDEFHEAQSRRFARVTMVNGDAEIVRAQPDGDGNAAIARSTTPLTSH